jgi:hypothetical protein
MEYLGSDLAASSLYSGYRSVIERESTRKNAGTFAAPVSETHCWTRALHSSDMSIGSLTVGVPEAGDLEEQLEP